MLSVDEALELGVMILLLAVRVWGLLVRFGFRNIFCVVDDDERECFS
jgi:hypothetical protein